MALANNCNVDSIQPPCAFKPGGSFGFEEGDGSEKTNKNLGMMSNNSSSPSSASSSGGGFRFRAENCQPHDQDQAHDHDHNSVINFKSGYDHNNLMHSNTSLLSFDQQNQRLNSHHQKDHDYSLWESSNQWNHHHHQISPKYSSDPRLMEDFNCFDTASNYGFMINTTTSTTSKDQNQGDWLFSEATTVTDCLMESGSQDHTASLKRPNSGESSQALKKQCSGATTKNKTNKSKPSAASKDPQSIAAKNRRERISERLKVLQELVPNGSKVDLVTMLEKAISYVKFLQLQVKVLATDEFWPVQGGKAPDISQVKEAIDAILSSQRDRNSSSK